MMSTDVESESGSMMCCCASCGIAEVDDIKLKTCTACKSVRYCSVICQREHRPQHKRACKKRAAEIRDEILFKQPESSHLGDCPICCLPLSLDDRKCTLYSCCSKLICIGCVLANYKAFREKGDMMNKITCPFCRRPMSSTKGEADSYTMKRIEVNDPVALRQMGFRRYAEGNYKGAFEYWTKAAELGDAGAHYELSHSYREGKGGIEKDEKKAVYHLEEAAIGGHPMARNNLGCADGTNHRHDRAMKHLIIAAKLGYDNSIELLRKFHASGVVSKEDFASALRAHQAAVDATKSPQREEAEVFRKGALLKGEILFYETIPL